VSKRPGAAAPPMLAAAHRSHGRNESALDLHGRQPPSYRDMFDVHPNRQYAHMMR